MRLVVILHNLYDDPNLGVVVLDRNHPALESIARWLIAMGLKNCVARSL